MKLIWASISLVLSTPLRSGAEDVPQFRGLGGAGVSGEKGLPVKWDEKENLLWKASCRAEVCRTR